MNRSPPRPTSRGCAGLRPGVSTPEAAIYRVLLGRHEEMGIETHPNRVYSAVSYAGALARSAGLAPALVRMPSFPRPVLADWMGAYHGGENLIGFRAPLSVPIPVTITDFTGGFVAAHGMTGAWAFHIAERVDVRLVDVERTRAWLLRLAKTVNRWLERPGPVPPLSRADLHRLAFTLLYVMPGGDVLPHRRRRIRGTPGSRKSGRSRTMSPFRWWRWTCSVRSWKRAPCLRFRLGHRLVADRSIRKACGTYGSPTERWCRLVRTSAWPSACSVCGCSRPTTWTPRSSSVGSPGPRLAANGIVRACRCR